MGCDLWGLTMDTSSLRSAAVFAKNLIQDIQNDPNFVEALKADPKVVEVRAAEAISQSDAEENRVIEKASVKLDMDIYKIVVGALGGSVLLAMVSILIISVVTLLKTPAAGAVTQIAIPDGLVALASAAVGALAGLLTPLSRR